VRTRRTGPLAVVVALAGLGPTFADEAPARIVRKDAENFSVAKEGELRVVGDPNRYDILLPTDVLFDFDESGLRPEAEPLLDQVAAKLREDRPQQVHVRGHTDSKGTSQHNFTLSLKRAKAVCDRLEAAVGGFNMCIGRGEAEPLLPNENADGSDNPLNRQLNRRVTVSVVRYPDANRMLGDADRQADEARKRLPNIPAR
jgi:outer membrane protein OmpA-like peptidoglycan-associated protein